ncbi:MAG: succinate dehydrogenase cytochrome b subunit [Saprospiraceae bacterium]|nr:succinate dehydrogenase cytochrome b subunit [Saprospiraceae bacterium]MCB0622552.1 succinate dehydrogenase cytochrome b subunit [Saprospiraceae bacterium]MCB0677418.1 succinate dehydrogenase cytochrome b subunit [Saprospiraceae bacterium]MCB0680000.1 succinate dehydrogenase cytochrome b subunit [Saprospiraceae bacterium]
MGWFTKFLTSSIGQKLIMSLTGLFLILFLLVHLAGNLQLLHDDQGEAFNKYAKFMTTFTPIKVVSYLLYAFIILHAIQGLVLARTNSLARGAKGYAVKVTRTVGTNSFASRYMGPLGVLILVFLGIHMGDFWWAMKSHQLELATYDGMQYQNLYTKVYASFQQEWIVGVYLLSMAGLAFHLLHGFQSAFQTLGLNHKKYTPVIKFLGKAYAILVPIGFAIIPIYFYFFL